MWHPVQLAISKSRTSSVGDRWGAGTEAPPPVPGEPEDPITPLIRLAPARAVPAGGVELVSDVPAGSSTAPEQPARKNRMGQHRKRLLERSASVG